MTTTCKKLRQEKHLKPQARPARALLLAGQLALAPLGSLAVPGPKKGSHRAPEQVPRSGNGGSFTKAGQANRLRRRALGVAASATAITATATLSAGVTFGLLSATKAGSANTFATGTVSLTSGSPIGTCTAAALFPSSSATTCSLQVTYMGSVPAWMGLDVFIATKSSGSTGAENLYNPSNPNNDNPPILSVKDNQSSPVTYTLPTTALSSCPSSGPLDGVNYSFYNKCYDLVDLLVSTSAFSNGGSDTFTTSLTVPVNNGTNYQGGSAVVVVRPHVVQSRNNGYATTNGTSGGTACTPGQACAGIATWS